MKSFKKQFISLLCIGTLLSSCQGQNTNDKLVGNITQYDPEVVVLKDQYQKNMSSLVSVESFSVDSYDNTKLLSNKVPNLVEKRNNQETTTIFFKDSTSEDSENIVYVYEDGKINETKGISSNDYQTKKSTIQKYQTLRTDGASTTQVEIYGGVTNLVNAESASLFNYTIENGSAIEKMQSLKLNTFPNNFASIFNSTNINKNGNKITFRAVDIKAVEVENPLVGPQHENYKMKAVNSTTTDYVFDKVNDLYTLVQYSEYNEISYPYTYFGEILTNSIIQRTYHSVKYNYDKNILTTIVKPEDKYIPSLDQAKKYVNIKPALYSLGGNQYYPVNTFVDDSAAYNILEHKDGLKYTQTITLNSGIEYALGNKVNGTPDNLSGELYSIPENQFLNINNQTKTFKLADGFLAKSFKVTINFDLNCNLQGITIDAI